MIVDVIILTVYTVVEGVKQYPDGPDGTIITGLQARKIVNRENPEDELGVGVVMRMSVGAKPVIL